jgi:hypothetical protein
MLSESRFTEELRTVGAAPPLEDARGAWDAGAQLNVLLRDPGGDLLQGHVPEREPSGRPLTRLAARALAALEDPKTTSWRGVVLTPYGNYRGAEVIGAWRWLPEHGFGVAAEVETREILAPLRYLEMTFGVLFVLLCAFVATTLASTFSAVSLRRRMRTLRRLGPYHLGEVLGRGGMGTVFLAEHALLKRRTAVKTLSQTLSPESVARFEEEVHHASHLTHPNTIEIYDFGRTEEGLFYYAMEYLEGMTLARLVREHGPLPPERAVHLLRQMCASLGEAHRKGPVHQDIKPQNVMVCERGGEYDVVKVLDFGLVARVRAADTQLLSRRRGTPLYMAPERVTGTVWADARADVYSVGAVAYYLLTGRPVFEAVDLADLLHAVVNDVPTPVSALTSVPIPQDLDSLIAECLAKDPEDRPQSIFAVRERLESLSGLGEWTQTAAAEWWVGVLRAHSRSPR